MILISYLKNKHLYLVKFARMKKLLQSKYLLTTFLVVLCIINIIQGYFTELLADEAYYWVYSNFLEWGYFDHPPMVAIWITISKFFFTSSELSVRFFSAIALSINFYLVWLLIENPNKKEYTWLYILIVLSTALFNVYGFIAVPDAPLMLFATLFLLGYQKYLIEKSFLSYALLTISMAGMMYSKYTSALIVIFVILSNFKLLVNYKLWLSFLIALLLFTPHLYWQYVNYFPSFRYHLFERGAKNYKIEYTTTHLLNLIAIIGFTFPIMYLSFFKNLKNRDLFQKALNYIVIGFAVFFFVSSFKDHVQAQWVLPISIPLIIITFNYLVDTKKHIKLFKILAFITIGIIFILRFFMINGSILPHKLEVHNNKKWVTNLERLIADKTPFFVNSYQNASLYWFYSKKRPYQYNTWWSRKNQYEILKYNKHINVDNAIFIGTWKEKNTTDSVKIRNNDYLHLSNIGKYKLDKNIKFLLKKEITIHNNKVNKINLSIKNKNDFNLNLIDFYIVFKSKNNKTETVNAKLKNNHLEFVCPNYDKSFNPVSMQIIGTSHNKIHSLRLSDIKSINFTR